ncbi:hypothetical protein N9Y74_02740 [Alphaproteobacteria bacterium]|nr:hypothetical protein [Alphaproteobacteria bacterium]
MNTENQNTDTCVSGDFANYLESLENVIEFIADDVVRDWEDNGGADDHLWHDVVRVLQLYRALKLSAGSLLDDNGEVQK